MKVRPARRGEAFVSPVRSQVCSCLLRVVGRMERSGAWCDHRASAVVSRPEVGAPLLHAARCSVMTLSCFLWGWVMTASPSTRLLHQLHTQPRTDTPTCWPPPPAAAHAGVCTLNSPAQPRSLKRKPPPLCPPAPQHWEADLHLCSPGFFQVFQVVEVLMRTIRRCFSFCWKHEPFWLRET